MALGSESCASSRLRLAIASDIPEFGFLLGFGLNPKVEPCSALTCVGVGAAR